MAGMYRTMLRCGRYVAKQDPRQSRVDVARAPPLMITGDKLANVPNREFSVFIAESATIESLRALGLEGITKAIESRKFFLTPKELVRIVSGLCRLNVIYNNGLVALLGSCLCDERLHQLLAHELAFIAVEVTACARRIGLDQGSEKRLAARSLVSVLGNEFSKKINAASTVDLSHMTTAVADFGIVDVDLMTRISQCATIQVSLFKGPELADLVLGFALLGFKSDEFLHVAIPRLMNRMPLLDDIQLLQLGFTVCKLSASRDSGFIKRYIEVLTDGTRKFSNISREVIEDFELSITALEIEKAALPSSLRVSPS